MSYNGSGTFQINTSGQPVVAGTVISATAFNALTADLATGLSTAITKDGQTTTTARIPFAAGISSTLTTDSSSTSTGSIITAGGVGVAKNLYVGVNANVAGTLGVTGVSTFAAGTAAAPAITTTGDTNTGIFFPAADTIAFSEGGAESMRIDASGNMGLGVTPSAFGSGSYKALQIGGSLSFMGRAGGSDAYMMSNTFFDQTNYKYVASLAAARYTQSSGEHQWLNAASGTAGNTISFTQAMTLNASGNLGVGITSPAARLDVFTTDSSLARFTRDLATDAVFSIGADNDGTILESSGINTMRFVTSGAERARIDSNGNLLVGKTAVGTYNANSFGFEVATGTLSTGHLNGSASGSVYNYFLYNGSVIGSITQSGTTAVLYNTTSDYRLKENVQPLSGALARVASLKPCTYTWKSAPDEIGEGFIAHELAEVCPQAVNGEKDAVNEDGSIKPQGIDTSFLVATLTAAIQEQQAIITQLQADVAALKGTA